MMIILILTFLLGVILRIIPLLKQNFWLDEAYSFYFANNFSLSKLLMEPPDLVHPSFYYIILHFVIKFFGANYLILRLPSIFFFLLSLYFIRKIGKLINKKLAYIYLIVFIFSSFQIHYSWQARMYSLVIFFIIASIYYFIKIFFKLKKDIRINSWDWLMLFLLSLWGYFIVYSYFLFSFSLIFILIFFYLKNSTIINYQEKKKSFWFIFFNLLFCFLISYFYLFPTRWLSFSNFNWVAKPNLSSVVFMVNTLTNLDSNIFLMGNPQINLVDIIRFLLVLIVLLATHIFLKDKIKQMNKIYLILFLLPIFLVLIISLLPTFSHLPQFSIFLPRFILVSNIGFNFILGNFIYLIYLWWIKKKDKKILIVPTITFVLITICNIIANINMNYNFEFNLSNDYFKAVSTLKNNYHQNDTMIVFPNYNQVLFDYYWQNLPPKKTGTSNNFDNWLRHYIDNRNDKVSKKTKQIYLLSLSEQAIPEQIDREKTAKNLKLIDKLCLKRLERLQRNNTVQLFSCQLID